MTSLESSLRQAATVIQKLKGEVSALKNKDVEPVAIIGLSARLPGASNVHELWQALQTGKANLTDYQVDKNNLTCGLMTDIDHFDAGFFNISPREAKKMDVRQRIFLEQAWEAIENAGLQLDRDDPPAVGIFVGASKGNAGRAAQADNPPDAWDVTGSLDSFIAGRLSYILGVRGPSLTLDTACSSSLVALHLAVKALRAAECDVALAGGIGLVPRDTQEVRSWLKMNHMSRSGACRTFDADADGIISSEGCGVVVLKRLSDALRDGDRIAAVIRGTAVNHDGHTQGLTVPSGAAQEAVIRAALQQAGVRPADVGYVECHGTGTRLGDPIEVQALGAVLAEGRDAARPVILGSVKSNIGHTDAAAGIAGLIKTVLAMQHGTIPQNLHFATPNPHIPWDRLPVTVAAEATPWPRGDRPRIAGVSAFGMSGTNAHVILEEAPAADDAGRAAAPRAAQLLVLSGRTDAAVRGAAQRLAAHLRAHPEAELRDTAWSLATTRSHHEHRLALVADGHGAAAALLEQLARGELPGGTRGGVSTAATRAWLFTGQGSQRCGMGRELWAEWPAFREAFDAACAALDSELGGDLKAVMWGDDERLLAETGWTQPALFALQAGLAALWRSWGVEPDFVAGHSLGELSAAYAAGVFTLEEAARLVAARGRLMQALPAGGSMAALNLPEAEVRGLTAGLPVSLAAVNGPSSVVISGESGAVQAAMEKCVAAGGRATALAVSHAFHSALMAPMLSAFRDVAESVVYRRPSVAVVSNVSGKLADEALCTAEYWVAHVMETVRFADGIATLAENGVSEFIELGPQGTLLGMAAESLEEETVQLVASLQRQRGETQAVLEGLGALHVHGASLSWPGVFSGDERRVALPLYAWQRERYWIDALPQTLSGEDTGHPLLGRRISLAGEGAVFESFIAPGTHGWLYDHVFGGLSIMPGTGWAEIFWAAGHHYFKQTHTEVASLVIRAPLVMEPAGFNVQVHIKDRGEFYEAFAYSQSRDPHNQPYWQLHASAEIYAGVKTPQHTRASLYAAKGEYSAVNTDEAYAGFTLLGVEYRDGFRGVSRVSSNGRYTLAELTLPEDVSGSGYGGHPVLLDSAIQAMWAKDSAAIFQQSATEKNHFSDVYLLFSIDSYVVWQTDARRAKVAIAMRKSEQNDNGIIADMVFYDENDEVVIEVTGLRERLISYDTLKSGAAENAAVYRTRWKAFQPAPAAVLKGSYLVVAQQNDGLGENTAALLRARGMACEVVDFTQLASATPADNIVCCFASPAAGHAASWTPLSHALKVLQHLAQQQAEVRLWWVTRDAVSENHDTLRDSAQYALWGAGRTLMFEHPEYQCTLIDLPAAMGADALIPAITRDYMEQEIRLTASGEYVARLEQVKESDEGHALQPSGTILITGGLGGVARQIALKLAQAGAAHLLLTGRRGLDTPGAAQTVAELEQAGARVTVIPADIADPQAVAQLLEQIPPALPLQGVIHAAGVLEDGILHEQSDMQLARVFSAKVQGAIHLDRLTREHKLDFFVLFSSIAGTLGSAGQGGYAAANACLDAIAANRRTLGLAGQSLAWGLWTDEASNALGVAAGLDAAQLTRLQKTGVGPVTPELGGKLFARLLGNQEANLLLAPFDLPQLKANFGESVPSLWQDLLRADAVPKPLAGVPSLAKELASLPEAARMERVVDVVRSAIMAVLSINANGINISRPLSELGLDSLTAVELRNALRKTTGKTLPTTLAFDYPTISDIALYILRLFTAEITAAQEEVPESAPLTGTHVATADLSEEEVDDELAKYINEFLN